MSRTLNTTDDYDAGRMLDVPPPVCPVDRLPARRRSRLCVRLIWIGGLNFLLFTLMYAVLGGDAPNGHVERGPDGAVQYFVRGHFMRSLAGEESVVSFPLWIYSYAHSIVLPLTSGAMVLSMLVLARPLILATMRDGRISGSHFITLITILVIGFSVLVSGVFVVNLVVDLRSVIA